MATDRKERIAEILEKAAELPPSRQLAYVMEVCGDDGELAEEVVPLLGNDDEGSLQEFLDSGLPEIMKSAARQAAEGRSDYEARQLQREELEEKSQWEGRFIGEEFEGEGRYRIIRLRRFGLMASLFFGRDRKIDKDVVIKIPRLSAYAKGEKDDAQAADAKANIRNNFRREFHSLVKLANCAYVVHVLDIGELPDGRPFIVQEYIEGRNALELLDANRDESGRRMGLAFRQVADIVRLAGYGLEAAHKLGILHRDLKSENIMTDGATAKLIDFNAAAVRLPISPLSTVFKDQTWGTLGYVSPEQLTNMMETDTARRPLRLTPASDIYSLAVTAYQLLTGLMPFSSNAKELIEQQAACSFRPASKLRPGVPAEVDALLTRALAYGPTARPQSAREFGELFAGALEIVGAATAHVSPPQRPTEMAAAPTQTLTWSKPARTSLALMLLFAAVYGLWLAWDARETADTAPPVTETVGSAAPTPASPEPATAVEQQRTFSFWLTQTSNCKLLENSAERVSERTVFKSGDCFAVNLASPQNGYLYLLNEGKNHRDVTTFYYQSRFPVAMGATVLSECLCFDDKEGTEKFWLLFSNSPVKLLDRYDPPRELPEDKTVQVRGYLNQNVATVVQGHESPSDVQTRVSGSGETIAYKLELRHEKSSVKSGTR